MIHYILNYEGGKSIDFHALSRLEPDCRQSQRRVAKRHRDVRSITGTLVQTSAFAVRNMVMAFACGLLRIDPHRNIDAETRDVSSIKGSGNPLRASMNRRLRGVIQISTATGDHREC